MSFRSLGVLAIKAATTGLSIGANTCQQYARGSSLFNCLFARRERATRCRALVNVTFHRILRNWGENSHDRVKFGSFDIKRFCLPTRGQVWVWFAARSLSNPHYFVAQA